MIRRTASLFAAVLFLGVFLDGSVSSILAASRGRPLWGGLDSQIELAVFSAFIVSLLGAAGFFLAVFASRRFWSKWPSKILVRAAVLGALIAVGLSAISVPEKIADRIAAYLGKLTDPLWPDLAVSLVISVVGTAIGLIAAWFLWVRGSRSEAVA